jgi:hypothetical protein
MVANPTGAGRPASRPARRGGRERAVGVVVGEQRRVERRVAEDDDVDAVPPRLERRQHDEAVARARRVGPRRLDRAGHALVVRHVDRVVARRRVPRPPPRRREPRGHVVAGARVRVDVDARLVGVGGDEGGHRARQEDGRGQQRHVAGERRQARRRRAPGRAQGAGAPPAARDRPRRGEREQRRQDRRVLRRATQRHRVGRARERREDDVRGRRREGHAGRRRAARRQPQRGERGQRPADHQRGPERGDRVGAHERAEACGGRGPAAVPRRCARRPSRARVSQGSGVGARTRGW